MSAGGSHDRVTDSLEKSMTFRFTGGPGLTVEEDREILVVSQMTLKSHSVAIGEHTYGIFSKDRF